jgi:hypothetical protein
VLADLNLAQQDYTLAQAALRQGNLAGYGQDIAKMEREIQSARAAARAGGGAAPKPGATPSPAASR